MIFSNLMIAQEPCEDPNAFTKNSACGTEFDLCIDRYIMDENTTMELQVFTNDMNMFDPCMSFICEPCSNGTLDRLPNCNWTYTPNEGFFGNDTFYYAMVINDMCTDSVYCGENDGKIWTVYSRYTGPDGLDLVVKSKKGNGWEFVGEVDNLQNGDYFLIDGSHLSTSQANWTYTFIDNEDDDCDEDYNGCVYDEVIVHTSCSQQIMGEDFGLFRVVSGCIATPQNKGECASEPRSQTYTVTSQWIDTTMVVITVFKPLPILLDEFTVRNKNGKNLLEWRVISAINESSIEVEKSIDGKNFYWLGSISPITVRAYTFEDSESQTSKISYYRLKVVSMDNTYTYSKIVSIQNEWASVIQIFPNPTDGDIFISCQGDLELAYQYEIFDLAGTTQIRDYSQEQMSTVVHLSDYEIEPGMYIVRLEFKNGGVHLEKIIYTKE